VKKRRDPSTDRTFDRKRAVTAGDLLNSHNGNHQWYALQVRPRFEKLAARHLNKRGLEEYLPLYASRRVWSDRAKIVELPLFPGYTFCRFDTRNRLPILVVPGVLSIVGIGGVPTPITDGEILAIQRLAGSGLRYGPWPWIHAGQRVCVERGPLAGLEGVVVRVKSDLHLILELPLLQRSVFVDIDSACVEIPAPALIRAGRCR
jgi:transcription antitermination factor NusG